MRIWIVVELEQTGPNGLTAVLIILVEATAMMTTAAAILTHHGVDNTAGNRAIAPVIQHTHVFPGSPGFARQFEADLVIHVQWPHGHANRLTEIIDLDRMHTLGQQVHTFVEIGTKGA